MSTAILNDTDFISTPQLVWFRWHFACFWKQIIYIHIYILVYTQAFSCKSFRWCINHLVTFILVFRARRLSNNLFQSLAFRWNKACAAGYISFWLLRLQNQLLRRNPDSDLIKSDLSDVGSICLNELECTRSWGRASKKPTALEQGSWMSVGAFEPNKFRLKSTMVTISALPFSSCELGIKMQTTFSLMRMIAWKIT